MDGSGGAFHDRLCNQGARSCKISRLQRMAGCLGNETPSRSARHRSRRLRRPPCYDQTGDRGRGLPDNGLCPPLRCARDHLQRLPKTGRSLRARRQARPPGLWLRLCTSRQCGADTASTQSFYAFFLRSSSTEPFPCQTRTRYQAYLRPRWTYQGRRSRKVVRPRLPPWKPQVAGRARSMPSCRARAVSGKPISPAWLPST